jgi:hypothetical protein
MRPCPRHIARQALVIGLLLRTFACAGAATPSEDYLAARDRAIAALQKSPAQDPAGEAHQDAALADLQDRLHRVVGALGIAGFPDMGKSNLEVLTPELGFGKLDAMTADASDGTTVYVTTVPLLRAWLAGHRNWWRGARNNPPANVAAAFTSPDFYTQAISPGSAAFMFAELPVVPRPGDHDATAVLLSFAQDFPAPDPPHTIAVALVRDGRAIILLQPIKHRLAQIAACKASWDRNNKAAGESDVAEEEANNDFMLCFNHRFRFAAADYAATVRQAQALLDRVPGDRAVHTDK